MFFVYHGVYHIVYPSVYHVWFTWLWQGVTPEIIANRGEGGPPPKSHKNGTKFVSNIRNGHRNDKDADTDILKGLGAGDQHGGSMLPVNASLADVVGVNMISS